MKQFPEALAAMAAYRQFLLYKIVPGELKTNKIPINPITCRPYPKGSDWPKDPNAVTDADTVLTQLAKLGDGYGLGFLLKSEDPFFFLDIDACLVNGQWSPLATQMCQVFAGAAVEISSSGNGLHIFGTGTVPGHGCRNDKLGLEFYTEGRFVALTGTSIQGSAATDCSAALPWLVENYFNNPVTAISFTDWTTTHREDCDPIFDDANLLEKALSADGMKRYFSSGATFRDLWEANTDVLARFYPDPNGVRPYDESGADGALAAHLLFWTSGNCERTRSLMELSALRREKWDREDYLRRTIIKAQGVRTHYYGQRTAPRVEGLPALKASSPEQRIYAERVRDEIFAQATPDQVTALSEPQPQLLDSSTWLTMQGKQPDQVIQAVTPIECSTDPLGADLEEPEIIAGYPLLTPEAQIEHFKGCVYIQMLNKVHTPYGLLLGSDQFNCTYGGYIFAMDGTGKSTSKKAWEAFTQSTVVRWPKAQLAAFRPDLKPGQIYEKDGLRIVNTYTPCHTPRKVGNPKPFLDHLGKLLPMPEDQKILLSYMAACVQKPGKKFQWAPLIQGTEGNGKTLFTRVVARAIGMRHVHFPKASDIDNKFNQWMLSCMFAGIEDIYVPSHKREILETLKPMLTGGDGIEIQGKGDNQITAEICVNFILNSNHKDAIAKTRNDRRFCVFYTAQQSYEDLLRDGLDGDYFPKLYRWLNEEEGYAIVTNYLDNYPISEEFENILLTRAPDTSSTGEAIYASMGGVEQEIFEAIEEGRPGFCGGWISSIHLDELLKEKRKTALIPPNKRRDLLRTMEYDYHPGLRDGRADNKLVTDFNKKPRLFIRAGSPHAGIRGGAAIARQYQEDQGTPAVAPAPGIPKAV